jgi:hypothetical protein
MYCSVFYFILFYSYSQNLVKLLSERGIVKQIRIRLEILERLYSDPVVKHIDLSEKHKAKFIVTIRRKKHDRSDKADINAYSRFDSL